MDISDKQISLLSMIRYFLGIENYGGVMPRDLADSYSDFEIEAVVSGGFVQWKDGHDMTGQALLGLQLTEKGRLALLSYFSKF